MRKFVILLISGVMLSAVGFGFAGFDSARPPVPVAAHSPLAQDAVKSDTVFYEVVPAVISKGGLRQAQPDTKTLSHKKTAVKGKVKIRDAIRDKGAGHNAVGCLPEC